MANKKQTIEEIEDELEDQELEDTSAEDEEESEEDVTEEADKKDDSEQDDSDDEDEDSSDLKKKEEGDREAIRERRRREKKMKRERDKRERMLLQNTIAAMADEIKKLKDGQGEVGKKFEGLTKAQIDGEISELGKIYNQANAAMEAAVAEGDGKKFTQAKAISDKAWARYTFLETQKRQAPEAKQEKAQVKESSSEERSEPEQGVQLGKEGKRLGLAFVNRNKGWYDPSGGNRDSKVVLAIDTDLYNEGYDPESKEYWDELEDRCKEYLPHRFKVATKPNKPKSIVGGSGNESSLSGGAEKSLPKEFVQTLKAAGYWDDAAKRKAAIKNYYSNKKGA